MKDKPKIAPWNDSNVRWVCENHLTKDQGHKVGFLRRECGGAGMPEPTEENRSKGYLD